MASLSLKNVCKVYPNGFVAVKDFNLEIADKEFIIFVGPSGCGKSTTLRMIAGLEEISSGELWIGDKLVNDVEPKDRDIAMVFQNYALYPHMTVYDNMAFGLKLRKVPKADIDKAVHEAAKILDIEHLLDRKPKALSGGQRQRISIGLSLMRGEKLIIADEPVSALDVTVQSQILRLLLKLHDEKNLTYMFISHDLNVVHHMCHRVIVMYLGRIVEMADVDELYDHPCHPYTRMLFDSILTDEEKETTDSVTVNEILPETVDGDSGCPFYGRCRYAGENCLSEVPTLTDIGTPGHPHLVRCERIAYGEKYTAAD